MRSPAPYEGLPVSQLNGIDDSINLRSTDVNSRAVKLLHFSTIWDEFAESARILSNTKLNWLLLFAPLAMVGSHFELIGEAPCFCFAGLALIPFAERLSFVTEQVAEHTNGTIGALLNATFGNAPEFLISSAALRSGYYRLVQLTLLGSVLTNLLFVFGLSCLVGGMRWQTQEIRVTSGNVSIAMLLIAALGLVLPAVLKSANESRISENEYNNLNATNGIENNQLDSIVDSLSAADISFSRFNAIVMILMYGAYLTFQLGTHKDEFDYSGSEYAMFGGGHNVARIADFDSSKQRQSSRRSNFFSTFSRRSGHKNEHDEEQRAELKIDSDTIDFEEGQCNGRDNNTRCTLEMGELNRQNLSQKNILYDINSVNSDSNESVRRRDTNDDLSPLDCPESSTGAYESENKGIQAKKSKLSDYEYSDGDSPPSKNKASDGSIEEEDDPMTMRMGILWLGVITIGVSFMSDILVTTIDGFAKGSKMSEVFTSIVIIPYFSNIAEQVSAVIFAHKNKMDLCVGVTVGSAIQIALCVLPGCVLVGWCMDRPMTLYFRVYETACLLLGILCMAAVLQGGTTNWIVGVFFMGVYLMIAAGFALHEPEKLSY
eukprot:CAMPEP_0198268278 /NCGR_PEP_ID=MMETSP1447-20131203/36497_1 /TAXON_ID=420782 /ORGANISM="Chaetoceros dichaeta, Strain CCMP1751" /LENGTH=601 /DNA_ID=CAMNT_0043959231 /DNA_START=46 /DNA_END=1851 /DNA_ORIENTATION=-